MAKPPDGTFFEHLEELRRRLFVCLAAFFVCLAPAFVFSDRLLVWMLGPLVREIPAAYFFSPADAFVVKIKVSMLAAAVLSSPVVAGQLWLFVTPALYGNEKKALLPLIFITTALFLLGAAFSFYGVIPVTLHFLLGLQNDFLRPMVSVSEYFSFLTSMVFAFGVAFNLPVFVLALVGSGLVSARMLNRFQRWAVLIIFILAAVLTPGPDIASQLMLAVPLLVLFELSILGAVVLEKLRQKNAAKALS